ncbi:MAG TPA: hypothetical protein VFH87_11885 [Candidatus Udaeobacter sp.]|nr:hypothetical protein [Candidatus Udaeobacter sp.]
MNSIKLNTRLGKCNLEIDAHLRTDEKAQAMLGQHALAFLVWHVIPASAYDKKSAYKRNSDYSDALGSHMRSETMKVLGDVFENIVVKTSKYDAPDPIAKLIKEFVSLGLSEADAKAQAEAVQAKIAKKPEQKTETETEATAEVEV